MADKTKKRGLKEIYVREEFKIAVKLALDKFRQDDEKKELEFPSSFTSKERAYIHRLSQNLGLKSKSRGKGSSRFLVVSKKTTSSLANSSPIKLSSDAVQSVNSLLQRFPLNSKERQELLPKTERSTFLQNEPGRGTRENKFIGKLSSSTPLVPPAAHNKELAAFRRSLPIAGMREDILNVIDRNQVILISGETGSGKTTQVPQFILEHATTTSVPCRVVCTQPRRISAISVAERVATERGERLGSTVGYQIRLESRISPKTLLSYCTNGVLLRTLMAGDSNLSFVTHVIVDEIHERDRFSDFLLISLRDLLTVNRKLKLILMSAALDIDLFVQYFGKCPVLHVSGRCFEVKPHFLEDVLKMTSYTNKEMLKHMKEMLTAQSKMENLKVAMDKDICEKSLRIEEKTDKALLTVENKVAEQSIAGEGRDVLEQPDNGEDVEVENVFDEDLQEPEDCETEEDPEQKLAEDSQEKYFVTQFPLEEDANLEGEEEVAILETEDDIGEDVLLEEEEEEEEEEEVEEEVVEEPLDDDEEVEVQLNTKGDLDEVPKIKILLKSGDTLGTQVTEKDQDIDEHEYLKQEMDSSISEAWLKGDEESFVQILHLIMNENISVDYQHTETKATALMVAAGRGCVEIVEQLLNMEANPHIREPKNGWAALDWARKWEHSEVVELLESYMTCSAVPYCDEITLEKESTELSEETKELLSLYHKTFDDERVDLDLILCLIKYICTSYGQGSILVFLPGYDDIITLKERLAADKEFGNMRRYQLFTLHSSMQPSDQRKVFRRLPSAVRKIILSTNIAETSVTIDDVVYVVDSGKVKEKSFDALTSMSTLHSVWVSKSSAIQRRGRAGRCSPGVCFHLFSRVRYESLQEYQLPELLRVPLQELCLHTKLLAGTNTPIADFLAKAPEAPSFLVLRNAVMLLKTIDALDRWEDLTDLGRHIADLPLEPRLGKMILYSVVLKCLDPVVTVACALAYRDPFVLPMNPSEKRDAIMARKKFAVDPFSDHLTFVKAFRGWQRARSDGFDKNFCRKNYLSPATLEMMAGIRSQILGHLKGAGFVRPRGGGDIRDLNSNSDNWAVVKAAICAGMYPQIARVDRSANRITTQKEDKIRIHNWSVLHKPPQRGESLTQANLSLISKLPSDWIVYEEMSRMYTSVTVKCCTLLSAVGVALAAGPSLSSENVGTGTASRDMGHADRRYPDAYSNVSSDSEEENNREGTGNQAGLKVDEWISLTGSTEAVNHVTYLRHKFQALFIRRIRSPARPWTQADEAVVRAVVAVLTAEEHAINPTLVPARQRRTHTGVESNQELRPRIENRPRSYPERGDRYPAFRDRERYPSGSRPTRPDSLPLQMEFNKKESDSASARSPADHEKTCEARYFIIKCNNQRNLEISLARGIWATTIANEKKLNRAFKESKHVFLIFSVQGSGHFQGYARMVSTIGKDKSPEFGSSALGGVFSVDWMKKASIPFQQAHHLVNPWNDNKKVQISRDGQEVEPKVGKELCKLWEQDPSHMGNNSRYQSRPGVSRGRAKPPNQSVANSPQPGMASHGHWQASPSALPGSAVYQVYASHAASMPIPVPIPSAHSRHPVVQQAFPRPIQVASRPQAPVAFTTQPMSSQQQQVRVQSQRYPLTQSGHVMPVRGMGPTNTHPGRHSMQPYAPARK